MATIEKFEDLICWQKARQLAYEIYLLTLEKDFCKDFSLVDQIRRSSGSAMDNVAEGFERGGNKELIHFLFISKSSASECKSQLYRAFDRNYITEQTLNSKKAEIDELTNLIGGFINYLQDSKIPGRKFNTEKNQKP